MEVQWLGLCTFTTMAGVQSLVVELRSNKLHGMAKRKSNASKDHQAPPSHPYCHCCWYSHVQVGSLPT